MQITGVITWVINPRDGVYIEREQLSTALKQMPHYTTWGGTYVTRPVALEDRKQSAMDHDINDIAIHSKQADVITGIRSAAQGIRAEVAGATYLTENISTNSGTGGTPFLTGYSEADGFMKLGDIRGEFSPSRNTFYGGTIFYLKDVSSGLRGQGSSGDTVTSGDGTDLIGSNGESGFASWQDVRDHNHGNRTNWDVICDIGTSIKQTSVADALTNSGTEGYTEVEWTYLKGDVWTNGSATSFEDRLALDFDANDAVFDMRQNIGCSAHSCSSTQIFEPAAGMDNVVESLNPVAEIGGQAGPGGSTFMTGSVSVPTDNFVGNPYPSPIS